MMPSRAATEYRYEKLTWPEMNDAIELGKVCIIPCGAVEQHGPHLPLDVDLVCPTEIARGAGKVCPEKILVLPTVACEEAVKQLVRFVHYFKDRPIDVRRDLHRRAPTMPMPWGQDRSRARRPDGPA